MERRVKLFFLVFQEYFNVNLCVKLYSCTFTENWWNGWLNLAGIVEVEYHLHTLFSRFRGKIKLQIINQNTFNETVCIGLEQTIKRCSQKGESCLHQTCFKTS